MVFGMRKFFGKDDENDYIELDLDSVKPQENKIVVKPFILRSFDNMDDILNSLREGYTIAVIDIKPLRSKDLIELKRAISKIKKTVDALEGTIVGFGENIIIATPEFAQIHKPVDKKSSKERVDFMGG